MDLSNNKILITGGATGLGFALAERFIEEGNTVIICGRRLNALEKAKRKLPGLIIKQYDLTSNTDRIDLYNWIKSEHNDLTVLVNNAGIQHWMNITDTDFFQKTKEEICINIEAPVHLTSLFIRLKSLKTIINITSGVSYIPFIKTPVFSATKAFLHSFTISLKELVKHKKIEVIEIIPPPLNTDLGGKGLHDDAHPVEEFIESIFKQLKEGKTELTFRYSDSISKANPEELKQAFLIINQLI